MTDSLVIALAQLNRNVEHRSSKRPALADRGEAVRALDIAFPAALPEGVERIDGSILDAAALAGAMAGAGAVIHCAAIADLWEPSRWAYDRVNMRGTCEVLIAARRAGARVVQVSSYVTLIGGPDKGEATLDETLELTPTDMLGPHPRSKREAELAALCAVRMGQEVVIVQPSAPVGPGDHRLTPPSRMIRDLAAGKTPAVLDCLLNLVDVRALAGGVIAARDKGRSGERYLLTGEDLTMAELAEGGGAGRRGSAAFPGAALAGAGGGKGRGGGVGRDQAPTDGPPDRGAAGRAAGAVRQHQGARRLRPVSAWMACSPLNSCQRRTAVSTTTRMSSRSRCLTWSDTCQSLVRS
ncbi:MAG: NAD-dependent epimerase/dehydratase family protein, partial [Proteobacteria bacterium]|nr:NAD-dependent epimerase/dehydratase family protein [Pseudomonadota bacterium]